MEKQELENFMKTIQSGEPIVGEALPFLEQIREAVQAGKLNYEDVGFSSEDIEVIIHTEAVRAANDNIHQLQNYEPPGEIESDLDREIQKVNAYADDVYDLIVRYGIVPEELDASVEELDAMVQQCELKLKKINS